jgi:hypothetical protein
LPADGFDHFQFDVFHVVCGLVCSSSAPRVRAAR